MSGQRDKPRGPKRHLLDIGGQFQAHISYSVSSMEPTVSVVTLQGWKIHCRNAEQISKPGNSIGYE